MAKGNHTGKGGFGDNPQNINRGGRPKDPFSGIIEAKLQEARGDKTRAEAICEQIVAAAEGGERWAIEYLYDRFAGKPRQSLEVAGDIERPIGIQIVRYGGNGHGDYSPDTTT